MAKLTRIPGGRADLEGWDLPAIDGAADILHDAMLKGAEEAVEWLFSPENHAPPNVSLAAYWHPKTKNPLTINLMIPFSDSDYKGMRFSFTLDGLVDDLKLDEELSEARVERIAAAFDGLAARLRALKSEE